MRAARACARSCTCPFWGTLSESLVSWHSSSFGRLCCITACTIMRAIGMRAERADTAQTKLADHDSE
jgi:hypothetical protein